MQVAVASARAAVMVHVVLRSHLVLDGTLVRLDAEKEMFASLAVQFQHDLQRFLLLLMAIDRPWRSA